jgi:hypothetical protein
MTEPDPKELKASRIKLVTIILVAFVPIFIAYAAFFYLPGWSPKGTTNQGELIQPPIDGSTMSAELLEFENWVLIQPATADCDDQCEQMLYLSRQVITGLGKDANRVSRAVLADGALSVGFMALLKDEHPDVAVIKGTNKFYPETSTDGPILLLMDPNTNVMMFYAFDKAGKPMLKDLKHLMKISNIG